MSLITELFSGKISISQFLSRASAPRRGESAETLKAREQQFAAELANIRSDHEAQLAALTADKNKLALDLDSAKAQLTKATLKITSLKNELETAKSDLQFATASAESKASHKAAAIIASLGVPPVKAEVKDGLKEQPDKGPKGFARYMAAVKTQTERQ